MPYAPVAKRFYAVNALAVDRKDLNNYAESEDGDKGFCAVNALAVNRKDLNNYAESGDGDKGFCAVED